MASDEMQVFLEGLKEKPSKNKLGSIEEQRADTDMFMANQAVPRNVLIDDFTLAGRPARKYFTEGVREDATLLYLHGGGYRVGSLDSHQSFMANLAVVCKTSVIALDYRLAPEDPLPAALDDAVADVTDSSSENRAAQRRRPGKPASRLFAARRNRL